jgi:sugar fermentation stimulation protein A
MPSSLVGVNTAVPNRLVKESILAGTIKTLDSYDHVRTEVRYGNNSRIDLLLEGSDGKKCFIEIKNCTLVQQGIAYFPDSVTVRGLKHLIELKQLVQEGNRCVMFYLIQRMDARIFRPADHIDSDYGRALKGAVACGVEIMVYDVSIDTIRIELNAAVPYELN